MDFKLLKLGEIKAIKFRYGLRNSNYLVTSKKGKYVLKIYNFKSKKIVSAELRILRELSRNGFPCPKPIKQYSYKGKPAVLFTYLEGSNPKKIDTKMAVQIGEALGDLHRLLDGKRLRVEKPGWDKKSFYLIYDKNEKQMRQSHIKDVNYLLDFAAGEMRKFKDVKARLGIIHPDIKLENILIKDGKLSGILDFDDITHGVYIQNIAITSIMTCFPDGKFNKSMFKALLDGYSHRFRLSKKEIRLIPYYIRLTLIFGIMNWCYKLMHRPKDAYAGAYRWYKIYQQNF